MRKTNLFQKITLMGCLGITSLFMGSTFFKDKSKTKKHDAFKIRRSLVDSNQAKILYSTMSMFYLHGFQQGDLNSFYQLHSNFQIEKPNIVVLPISDEQYEVKYKKVMAHPKYKQAMDRFVHYLESKNSEQIQNMKDLDLRNLQKLYMIDQCHKNKKCKLVLARKNKEFYEKLEEAEKERQLDHKTSLEAKVEDYTDVLSAELKPRSAFAFGFIPQDPFKVIIGVVEPQLMRSVAARWKQKFRQNYSHQIIEDEEVLERERLTKQGKGKPSM